MSAVRFSIWSVIHIHVPEALLVDSPLKLEVEAFSDTRQLGLFRGSGPTAGHPEDDHWPYKITTEVKAPTRFNVRMRTTFRFVTRNTNSNGTAAQVSADSRNRVKILNQSKNLYAIVVNCNKRDDHLVFEKGLSGVANSSMSMMLSSMSTSMPCWFCLQFGVIFRWRSDHSQ